MANIYISPYYSISVNGKGLDLRRMSCIESVEIDSPVDGSDTATIVINDPDFLYINDNIFVKDVPITIVSGIQESTKRETFTGFISAIDIDFPEVGTPSLTINCIDSSHVMNRKSKKRSWEKTTNAAVVQKIAAEYGFKCQVEPGYTFKVEDTITQSNQTDLDFLEGLAKKERDIFMCKLIEKTIVYKKMGLLSNSVATVHYREYPYNILSFSPRINKETRQEEIGKSNVTSSKSVENGIANSSTKRDTQGDSVETKSSYYKYNNKLTDWNKINK